MTVSDPKNPAPPFWSPRIAGLEPYVPGEQPRIENLVKLNTNENPHPPSPRAVHAIREAAANGLERYPDPTSLALREGATIAMIHRNGTVLARYPRNETVIGQNVAESPVFQRVWATGGSISGRDISPITVRLVQADFPSRPFLSLERTSSW